MSYDEVFVTHSQRIWLL